MLVHLIKIASIYKVGIFVLSLYVLSFAIASLSNMFNYIKNKINE